MILEILAQALRISCGGNFLDVFDCISAPAKQNERFADLLRAQVDFGDKPSCHPIKFISGQQAQRCQLAGASLEFGPADEKPTKDAQSDSSEIADRKIPTKTEEFKGSLFLIGGSAKTSFTELVKLGGEDPKVAVVGRASSHEGYDQYLADGFVKAGVKPENITIIVPKDLLPEDPNYKYSYDLPDDTDIVYFGGGAQDKLRREFDDHQLDEVKSLLKKGAIIAGNSAGTAVMSLDMISGGDENQVQEHKGFGLTPWAIMDTHVGERQRENRDVRALYQIGKGKLPVIGIDEDTSVKFSWKDGVLSGVVGGAGKVHIFQNPGLPSLTIGSEITSKSMKDPAGEEALMWDLEMGNAFEVLRNTK